MQQKDALVRNVSLVQVYVEKTLEKKSRGMQNAFCVNSLLRGIHA